MGQCVTCDTTLKATQVTCHSCGTAVPRLSGVPQLTPLNEVDTQEDFQTLITQRSTEASLPKTLPMVPPPFTPPPQIFPKTTPISTPFHPAPLHVNKDADFEEGLGDFTEIADELPDDQVAIVEDELDHTVDLEPEDFYSLDGETELTPFPTARLISPPQKPQMVIPAPPSLRPETSPIPQLGVSESSETAGVSSLLVLAHRSGRAQLQAGLQHFGAQHDPTDGLLEELYPHHFSIELGPDEVTLRPVSTQAELWTRVSRRVTLTVGDVIRAGHTKLVIARSNDVLCGLQQVSPHLADAHSTQLSLLAFNSAGLLEGAYPLQEGVTRIGRAFADITLSDPALSLSHAAILLEEGAVTLVDLGSESGLWRLIHEPVTLHRNMVFSAGYTLFVAR